MAASTTAWARLARSLSACALLAALLACPGAGWAIVVANESQHVVQTPSPYDMVGYFDLVGGASGTLVGPRQVITAKHVVQYATPATATFRLDLPDGIHYYTAASITLHPSADVALVTLVESTGLGGYHVYPANNESGQTGTIAGYGLTGTGSTGGVYGIGTKRWAKNVIDATSYMGDSTLLLYDFDGGGGAIADEGMVSNGDSGGPNLLVRNNNLELAGIHSQVLGTNPPTLGFFGDRALDIRISQFRSWLQQQVPGDANFDGMINGADYTVWAANYGKPYYGYTFGDFNLDHVVDARDYTLWADNYGFGTGVVSPAGGDPPPLVQGSPSDYSFIPEPASLALLLAGAAAVLRKRVSK